MFSNTRYDIVVSNNEKPATVPITLVVDSSTRNTTVYPDPGSYTLELVKDYRDIVSIELVSAVIPKSGYGVKATNNTLYFTFGGQLETCSIPIGNYPYDVDNDQPTTLITALQTAMNGEVTGTPFTVTFNAITQRFTITSNAEFTIHAGRANGIDKVIGLGLSDITSTANSITMPNNYCLQPDKYISLKIRDMGRCDGSTNALADSFAIIPLDTVSNKYALIKEGDRIDNDKYVYYYSSPLPRLSRLELTFYDPDGNVYNFNGVNHYLVFKIMSLSRPAITQV